MRIALVGRPFSKNLVRYTKEMISFMKSEGHTVYSVEALHKFLVDCSDVETVLCEGHQPIDVAISIGGDGTLLETVTLFGKFGVPILGINAGRLGFLAAIPIEKSLESIQLFFNGCYRIDERKLVDVSTNKDVFGELNFALNECAVLKKDTSSMIVVHTYLDGEFLNSYWADGLIISTPTGSTGYNLSCGGPLVMPRTQVFVLSPVNPHNLTMRPMVVPDNAEIRIKVEGRTKKFLLALDYRSKSVETDIEVIIKKASFHVNLIQIEGISYVQTLRNKLNWGLDARN